MPKQECEECSVDWIHS